jgi:hypothetical protein
MQADLADVSRYAAKNDGVTFILVVIDVFTRQGFAETLTSKSGPSVAAAMSKILRRLPMAIHTMQTDRGSEFFNKNTKKVLEEHNVKLFASHSLYKANYVERWIRTLRSRLHRYMTHYNTHRWLDVLPQIIDGYNNTPHSSLPDGMTPNDVNLKNQKHVWNHLYRKKVLKDYAKTTRVTNPKFHVGDVVRITMRRHTFTKEADNEFSEEVFTISKTFSGPPRSYQLTDTKGEIIEGRFYEAELSKGVMPDTFQIDEVLDTKQVGDKTMSLVKWRGYPSSMNEWIPMKNVISL